MENRKIQAEISSSSNADSKDETSFTNGGPSEFSDTGSDYSFSWDDLCGPRKKKQKFCNVDIALPNGFLDPLPKGTELCRDSVCEGGDQSKEKNGIVLPPGFLEPLRGGNIRLWEAGDYEDSSYVEATSSSSAPSSVERVERRKVDGKEADESLVCMECKRKRGGTETRDYDVFEMEKLSIGELIDSLKTEFRVEYFEKVKQILISRESKLKLEKEVEHLKLEVRKKHTEDLKTHKVAEEVVKKSLSLEKSGETEEKRNLLESDKHADAMRKNKSIEEVVKEKSLILGHVALENPSQTNIQSAYLDKCSKNEVENALSVSKPSRLRDALRSNNKDIGKKQSVKGFHKHYLEAKNKGVEEAMEENLVLVEKMAKTEEKRSNVKRHHLPQGSSITKPGCVRDAARNQKINSVTNVKKMIGDQKQGDSLMCHQCQRNDKGKVVRCTKCKTKRYCFPCISKWYPKMLHSEIAKSCPVCRGICNCTGCLRTDGRHKEKINSRMKLTEVQKVNHSRYIVHLLLPILKQIDKEQVMEKKVEAKIQGIPFKDLKVQKSFC